MKPSEYELLAPCEYNTMLKGYRDRERSEDMRRSFFVSLLVSPHLKRPISAKDIYAVLHEDEVAEANVKRREEDEAYLKELFPDAEK